MLYEVAARVPEQALALADAFWPGPLTIILPRGPKVADAVCAGLDTVGIRMPSHPAAQAVIRASGLPLAAPSANRSGAPSPTDAKTVWEDMQGRLPLILDGGECQVGVESTVVSLAGDVPMVLRPGYVTPEQMSQVLGCPVQVAGAVTRQLQAGETVRSPGMKYKHYAPKAEVTIVRGDRDTFARYAAAHPAEGLFCLCFAGDEAVLEVPCVHYGTEQDPAAQAHDLFSALRRLDEKIGSSYAWLCQCDCGKQLKVGTAALLAEPGTRSCGCGRVEAVRQTMDAHGTVADHCHFVDGTCVEKISDRKKQQKNNTSGCTGVQVRGNRYIASISFKGKTYYLGSFSKFEDAVRARKRAEERMFGEFLEEYYASHLPG